MPLFSVEKMEPDVMLGIWKINESVEDLFRQDPGLDVLRPLITSYKSEQRRLEVLAVRSLLHRMAGDGVELMHDSEGRPYLSNGMNVSVSHTKGCAAVIISPSRRVAVDVEYDGDRVERIAQRMMRPDETCDPRLGKLVLWCMKETLYKLYSDDRLALEEMRMLSYCGDETAGNVVAENMRRKETVDVAYRKFDGFVLTYAIL